MIDEQVPDYVLDVHDAAEHLSHGLLHGLCMLSNLLKATLSVKTCRLLVLSFCPDHLLPTCQLPRMGLLHALISGLEFTFQAQRGMETREEEET